MAAAASSSGVAGPRQLRRLLQAVVSLGADLDLTLVLERIVEVARDLVGARYAALGVLNEERNELQSFITIGLSDDERARIGALPKGHGILGLLITDPQPLRLPDLSEHPESFGFPPQHPPMTSFLGVPLYVRGEVFGNLYLTDKLDGDGFSDIDEELAVGLAAAAAVAIDNARLHEQNRELSLLSDRERIAHDLHDTVIQRLYALGLAMQGTARLAQRLEVTDRLQTHLADLDETLRQIRSSIFELDAARMPGASLRRDLLDVALEAGRVLGFDPVVTFDGPIDAAVDHQVATNALVAVREALSNVARHARATHVRIEVVADSRFSLVVVDDGVGLASDTSSGGSGLRNLQARAAACGGSVHVASEGVGTTVRWTVPLPLSSERTFGTVD